VATESRSGYVGDAIHGRSRNPVLTRWPSSTARLWPTLAAACLAALVFAQPQAANRGIGSLPQAQSAGVDLARAEAQNPKVTDAAAAVRPKPNIVIVLTDDEPLVDGRLIPFEPNVEAFADHGVTFTDFHSETPICCPARAGLLTGQHTHNHGVYANNASLFDPQMTIATQLQSVGYYTMLAGKYMNQYGKCHTLNCAPNVPPGWNRWIAFGEAAYYDYDLWIDGKTRPEHYGSRSSDYSTDVVSRKAVQMINAAPAGQPLFAWITPYSAHGPGTPAPRYANAPCNVANWKPPNWNEADVSDKPAYVRNARLQSGSAGQSLVKVCRAQLAVNDLVGAVRNALSATGRLPNTLFIYASDNGMNEGEHRLSGKSAPYDTRVPFFASWPRVLGTAPRSVTDRVQNIDLAPTLCELAGCSLGPYPNGQATPDGLSFTQLLLGTSSSLGRDAVLDELPRGNPPDIPVWFALTTTDVSSLARTGCAAAGSNGCRWHYIEYPTTGERELYDLSNGPCWTWSVGQPGDPCELNNAVGNPNYSSIVATLHNRLAQLIAEKG
jgi:N-acetylglucosamine-6-sulfatase